MIHKCSVLVVKSDCETEDKVLDRLKSSETEYPVEMGFPLSRIEYWEESMYDKAFPTLVSFTNSDYALIDTPFEQFDKLMTQYYSGVALYKPNPQ